MLLACVRMGVDQLADAAAAARALDGGGIVRLRAFLRCYALVIMDDFGRCVVRTGDELLSPESRAEFRAIKREVDQSLCALIEEAVADGSAAVADARIAAAALAGALNWTARWQRADGTLSADEVATRMADFLILSLRP